MYCYYFKIYFMLQWGHSPLYLAYWKGHDNIVNLLCSFGVRDMDQVRNVSDKCNNIFTICDDMYIVILHVQIYYKHHLILLLLLVI